AAPPPSRPAQPRTTDSFPYSGLRSQPGATPARKLLVEHLLDHDGLVVLRVACSVDQRHIAVPRCIEQRCQSILMLRELPPVASLELVPSARVVAEPLPELSARRDFF